MWDIIKGSHLFFLKNFSFEFIFYFLLPKHKIIFSLKSMKRFFPFFLSLGQLLPKTIKFFCFFLMYVGQFTRLNANILFNTKLHLWIWRRCMRDKNRHQEIVIQVQKDFFLRYCIPKQSTNSIQICLYAQNLIHHQDTGMFNKTWNFLATVLQLPDYTTKKLYTHSKM